MNQRYLDYADYNIWANNRLINNLSQVDEELLSSQFVGSFPSIKATLLHIWYAETGWLSRLNGKGWDVSNVIDFSGSTTELFSVWQATSANFKQFVAEADLENEVSFEHKKEIFTIPSREIVQTVFNHGSYHRGQVVMMMRQLGITKISQTDYIEWVRKKARAEFT